MIQSFCPGLNSMSNIISPTSLLLSATGTLAFKNCGLTDEVSTFTAPEMLQGRASSSRPATERVSAQIFLDTQTDSRTRAHTHTHTQNLRILLILVILTHIQMQLFHWTEKIVIN